MARGKGHRLYLTDSGVTFLTGGTGSPDRLDLRFDAPPSPRQVEGIMRLPGRVHYLAGNDPAGWITGVSTFDAVRYAEPFPGTEVLFTGTRPRTTLEMRLRPGTDPDQIAFTVGAEALVEMDRDGAVRIGSTGTELTLSRLRAWQVVEDMALPVPASWIEIGPGRLGIQLDGPDPVWQLRVVASMEITRAPATSADENSRFRVQAALGDLYVSGAVAGSGLAAMAGGAHRAGNSPLYPEVLADLLVTRLDRGGSPAWSTYLGGGGADRALALAVDEQRHVVVAGTTDSWDFPTTRAHQGTLAGGTDAFVARLLPDGSGLAYSTYLGGGGKDAAHAVLATAKGEIWVAGATAGGLTSSTPGVSATQGTDAFLARLSADGLLQDAVAVGGSGDDAIHALVRSEDGMLVAGGRTASANFPVLPASPLSLAGATDGFVIGWDEQSAQMVFSGLLGGDGNDAVTALAIGADGTVHAAGWGEAVRTTGKGGSGSQSANPAHPLIAAVDRDGSVSYEPRGIAHGRERVTALAVASDGTLWMGGIREAGQAEALGVPGAATAGGGGTRSFVRRLDRNGGEPAEELSDTDAFGAKLTDMAFTADGALVLVGSTGSASSLSSGSLEPAAGNGDGFVSTLGGGAQALVCDADFIGGHLTEPNAWHHADNWFPGVPTATENACIGSGFSVVLSAFSGAQAVKALEISGTGALIISGGSLDIDQDSTIGGSGILISGGTLTGNGNLTFSGALAWTLGAMSGAGSTIINANMVMSTGGTKQLFRRIENNSTITWTGGTFQMWDAASIVDNEAGGTFDVQGDLSMVFGVGFAPFNNKGLFKRSSGSGVATIGFAIDFINTGTVDVQTGTLDIVGRSATHSGDFDCTGTGVTIDWSGNTHTLDSSSSLTGTNVTFTGGTVIIDGTYSVDATTITSATATFNKPPTMTTLELNTPTSLLDGTADIAPTGLITWSSGSMRGTGDTIVNADMVMSTGATKQLLRRIQNNSTITWTGGLFQMWDASSVVDNEVGATFDVQGDLSILYGVGLASFNNKGLFERSTGAGIMNIGINIGFINTGTVDVKSGTLDIVGSSVTHTGSFDCTGTAIDWSGSTHTLGATSSLTGDTVTFTGASVVVEGTYSVDATTITAATVTFDSAPTMATLELSAGILTGSADIVPTGLLTWTGGSMRGTGSTIINADMLMTTGVTKQLLRRIENNSTITWDGGTFQMWDASSVLDNEAGGIFDVQGDLLIFFGVGLAPFNNKGLFKRSSGTGTATIGVNIVFTNTGTVDVQTGTLDIIGTTATHSGDFDCTGTTIHWGGSTHTLDSSSSLTGANVIFNIAATVIVEGAYSVTSTTITSATVTFNSAPTMTTLALGGAAGVLNGTADVAPSGLLTWTAGSMSGTGSTIVNADMVMSSGVTKSLFRRIENNSIVTWSGGTFQMWPGGAVDNEIGGTFDVQGDLSLIFATAFVPFNNKGLFVRSAGAGTMAIGMAIDFTNTGTVEVQTGTLSLSTDFAQTAGELVLNGGNVSAGTLVIAGGTVRGNGTITGNLTMSGTTSPGLSAGLITVTGNHVQNATGSFHAEIGGLTPVTQHDRLDITGTTATLGGTLSASLISGFVPTIGDGFTVMTYPAHSGTFATLNLPNLGVGAGWSVQYGASQLILSVVAGATQPGAVPPTMQISRSTTTAGDLTITWDAPCSAGATDARIYEGTVGSFSSHQAITCTDTGGDRTEDVTPASGSTYYLVVSTSPSAEGSYGTDSLGERPAGSPGACSTLPQDLTTCP